MGAAACGLFAGGLGAQDDAAAPPEGEAGADTWAPADAAVPEGGSDVADLPDANAGCDAGATSLVVTTGPGCPNGTTEENLVTGPVAGAGACGCGACTPTAPPTCSGAVTFSWGGTNNCVRGALVYNASSACTWFGFTFTAADYNRWSALVPAAGSCTAQKQENPQNVTTSPIKRCLIPPQSTELACAAEQAGGYRLCVPYGAGCSGKYSALVEVGTGATVSCAACSCALTATTCTVEYHGNNTCTNLKYTRALDGQCTATGNPQDSSHFTAYPTNSTCTTSPGTATPGLAAATRMCCTP